MNSKHTPGPLEYAPQSAGLLGRPESMRPDGYCIRAVNPREFGGTVLGTVNREPDARLFASAPDLLAALQAIVAQWENLPDNRRAAANGNADLGKFIRKARAAIARATA
jgi:hypothetical protein